MTRGESGILVKVLLGVWGVGMGYVNPCHGEMYSLRLDSLEAVYGGWSDPFSRVALFDFQQDFIAVHRAWLHVEATPDFPEDPSWLWGWANLLNGVPDPGYFEGVLEPWESLNVDVELTPGPGVLDGAGGVELWLETTLPYDGSTTVTEAVLWFDATQAPEPTTLALLALGAWALAARRR